jgi:hypothetical protein
MRVNQSFIFAMAKLTYSWLKEHLNYDPDTGKFTHCGKLPSNARWSGRVAGTPDRKGYLKATVGGKTVRLHRAAWLFVHGVWPAGEIDHINQIKTDNRISNLRVVSTQENNRNVPLLKNNKTGITGVSRRKDKAIYDVKIVGDNKRINLGAYVDFFEACCARKSAERRYNYHPNHGQPPREQENGIRTR